MPDLALATVLALLVLAPLLQSGFVLVGDMVFVPDQPWKAAWTGGDGGVPRAVPSDAWVALVDEVVPGALLQKIVLLLVLIGAGTGMGRLVAGHHFAARAGAITLYVWNPFVYERLAIGHWALLVGYAALPWVAVAALRLRRGPDPVAWALLATGLAAAAWSSPSGGVITLGVTLVLLWGAWRRWAWAAALGLWVNLPWLVPAFGNQEDQLAPDPLGVLAFAARADTPWGVLGSLLTFGGIWKESIVPDDRLSLWRSGLALLLVVVAVAGLVLSRRNPVLPVRPAWVLALGSLALAGASAVPALRPVVEWLVVHVPGGGMLRDSQKWLMPWVLVACTGVASALGWLQGRLAGHGRQAQRWVVAWAVLPLLALPSLAWGLSGFVRTEQYPSEWHELRAAMDQVVSNEDRVLVLPFSTYRMFAWNTRAVLDPVPRFFPGQMVTDDALAVPSGVVGGESALAERIRLAEGPEELSTVLAEAGVGWILVHRGGDEIEVPDGATLVFDGPTLRLYELEGSGAVPATAQPARALAYALVDASVLLGTAVLVGLSIRSSRNSDKPG